MYVYIRSEPNLYTVGFYDPQSKWQAESDHDTAEAAANRVAKLNGSCSCTKAFAKYIDARNRYERLIYAQPSGPEATKRWGEELKEAKQNMAKFSKELQGG